MHRSSSSRQARFSEPCTHIQRVPSVRDAPAALLGELAHVRWTGLLTFSPPEGELRVWLSAGRIAWAERCRQQRSLGQVLCELLDVELAELNQLAATWRERRLSLAEALLSEPRMSKAKLRAALEEHVRAALSGVSESPPCAVRLDAGVQTASAYDPQWTFEVSEILSERGGRGAE